MPDGPVLVEPPIEMYRVERSESALKFSRIRADVSGRDNEGNRFDVPGAGVLYAATTAQGALAEVTAPFRLSASVRQLMAEAGATAEELEAPALDASWRAPRVIRTIRSRDALPFLDIEAAATHTYLTERARTILISLSVPTLDVATVRGPSRLLTRGLATWIYQAVDDTGDPLYGGIRYLSRLSTDYECWAIFDETPVELVSERRITLDDPDLVAIAERHGIVLA